MNRCFFFTVGRAVDTTRLVRMNARADFGRENNSGRASDQSVLAVTAMRKLVTRAFDGEHSVTARAVRMAWLGILCECSPQKIVTQQ